MKICHVTSAHPPNDGRIFRRACVSAARAGYETYLVQRGETGASEGVYIVGIGEPSRAGRIYRMISFAKTAYQTALGVDADLYHLHDPELLPYALKLKRKGKKVVFDAHENYVEQIKCKPYLGPFAKVISSGFKAYLKHVLRRIDGLTFPGNADRPNDYEGMCQRIVATDNLPWLDELYDYYDEIEQKEEMTACYIGGLNDGRGLRQMIKACHKAGYKLYLAGNFSSDEYKKEIEEMPEYECTEYLGLLNREEIAKLLKKTEIGLCTLLNVGQYYKMTNLPTKAYEYMSMGLPVILNDSEYNLSFVKEHEIGICVDPLNLDEYEKTLKKMEDNTLKQRLGDNGRKTIKEKYCWDREQNNLLGLYKDVLEAR